MHNHLIKGTGVALITPFDKQGEIDFTALKAVVEFQIAAEIDYLVVLGTTSEAPTLGDEERQILAEKIAFMVNKRAKLILGVGGNDTRHTLRHLQQFPVNEYDAILSVGPYYNRPTQNGLIAHFETIANASPIPVVLYNVPARTATNILAQTTLQLANHPNIIGIKEASGNLQQCMDILQRKPENFELVSGDDLLTLPLLACGAIGVISVIANAKPQVFKAMVNDALSGNFTAAAQKHYALYSLMKTIFDEGNPAGIKALMNQILDINQTVRLPLVEASEELYQKIQSLL